MSSTKKKRKKKNAKQKEKKIKEQKTNREKLKFQMKLMRLIKEAKNSAIVKKELSTGQ